MNKKHLRATANNFWKTFLRPKNQAIKVNYEKIGNIFGLTRSIFKSLPIMYVIEVSAPAPTIVYFQSALGALCLREGETKVE